MGGGTRGPPLWWDVVLSHPVFDVFGDVPQQGLGLQGLRWCAQSQVVEALALQVDHLPRCPGLRLESSSRPCHVDGASWLAALARHGPGRNSCRGHNWETLTASLCLGVSFTACC